MRHAWLLVLLLPSLGVAGLAAPSPELLHQPTVASQESDSAGVANPFAPTSAATRTGDGEAASSPVGGVDVASLVLALGIVLVLIFVLRSVARRYVVPGGGRSVAKQVQVLGRTNVGPRQQVLLLKVGRRVLVIADSGGQMTALASIDDADEVAHLLSADAVEEAPTEAFGPLLSRQRRAYDADEGEAPALPEGLNSALERIRLLTGRVREG